MMRMVVANMMVMKVTIVVDENDDDFIILQ